MPINDDEDDEDHLFENHSFSPSLSSVVSSPLPVLIFTSTSLTTYIYMYVCVSRPFFLRTSMSSYESRSGAIATAPF
jgi:hypothetical protein